MDLVFWLKLLFLPVLIAAAAFFVAAEYAVITIRSTRIEEMIHQGLRPARTLKRLKDDISGSLASIQICITATNLLLGAFGEPAMTTLIERALRPLGLIVPESIAHTLGLIVGLLVVTFLTVVLSELLPKALTLQYTEQIAVWVARPIAIVRVVTAPLVRLMNWTGNKVAHLVGLGSIEIEEPVHSEHELEILVDRADAAGEFHEEHGDLVRRAFDFADLRVKHVMIPMHKVGLLDSNHTADELAHWVGDLPYTRWPLRDPRTGQINGIVNIKLVLQAIAISAGHAVILHDLAVPPTYLPLEMSLIDALAELRRTRRHLAIVRGEDGLDAGIVTLEDILEAIVGKIPSEVKPVRP